jgi:hypothetical protein
MPISVSLLSWITHLTVPSHHYVLLRHALVDVFSWETFLQAMMIVRIGKSMKNVNLLISPLSKKSIIFSGNSARRINITKYSTGSITSLITPVAG